jgi:peptidoglycan/xylan/chitin deacetylase (PgdA/CDA1 family)
MYHKILFESSDSNYSIAATAFEKQMHYLYEMGFQSITPDMIPELLLADSKKIVMITFDDGHETDFSVVSAILSKFGLKAVFFVTTGFLGKENYMSWEQILQLQKSGFSIHSHTHTHQLLGGIDKKKVEEELLISKKLLSERLGRDSIALSLPGGSYSNATKQIALNQGYKYIFTSEPDRNIINDDSRVFWGRVNITKAVTFKKFKKIVDSDASMFLKLKILYKIKNCVRACMGSQIYYSIWNKYFK